jgi:hypothetical protein
LNPLKITLLQARPDLLETSSNIANVYSEYIQCFTAGASTYKMAEKSNVTRIWNIATGESNKISIRDGMKDRASKVSIPFSIAHIS